VNGPKRLKDDPSFLEQTGCDLAAESELVGDYALAEMREAVVREVASVGAAASTGFQTKALLGLLTVLVGTTGLWWMAQRAPIAEDPATRAAVDYAIDHAEAPREVLPEEVTAAVAYAVSESESPAEEPPPKTEPQPAPAAESVSPGEPATAPVESEEDAVAMAEEHAPPQTAIQIGTLASENAVYELVGERMASGDYAQARLAMAYYLKQWPDGVHLNGILVTMVECMYRQSRWGEAEKLAELLVGVPGLAHRRAEIARLRAESLVILGRCEEAVAAAADGDRALLSAVKQQCRKARRARP